MKLYKKMENLKSRMRKHRVVIFMILFVCGYCYSSHFCIKKVSDREFEVYEHVARDFYNQLGKDSLYETPEGVEVTRTDTEIIVFSSEKTKYGKVIAKLKDGKLIIEKEFKSEERIGTNILIGIIFSGFWCCVIFWKN